MLAEKKVREREIVQSTDTYELFDYVDAETMDGKTVKVKRSMGDVRVEELNAQKARLLAEIEEIDGKLTVIAALE